jgi:hypothetical protein
MLIHFETLGRILKFYEGFFFFFFEISEVFGCVKVVVLVAIVS